MDSPIRKTQPAHGLQRFVFAIALSAGWLIVAAASSGRAHDDQLSREEREQFFETSIRPILATHCVECHGELEQSGDLRLDSRAALQRGGGSGVVIDIEHPRASRLLTAIRREGELKMPPDKPLSPVQIATMTRWIELGAPWPEAKGSIRDLRRQAAADHWAFQPVGNPEPPQLADTTWVRSPIDAFVLKKLETADLEPSPLADRRTLIRRLSYSLTGLPPTQEDVDRFVGDSAADAYESLIDRLLNSVHYGEHWARHWLDVARYSDTKGYVYAREERFWLHAWTYRDWVVRALNEDMPYDQFLLLQIAADQVSNRRKDDLAAMGFLTLGRRFLGVERDIIDDRIDVVCRGTMGLTVACARCHDHKYDPIPTADYYSLYGVFDSCREEVVRLSNGGASDEFESELKKRRRALEEARTAVRDEWSDRVRSRVGDYLTAQTEINRYPPKGFDQVFEKEDILPAFVFRWEHYLRDAKRRDDSVFIPWHRFADLTADNFASQIEAVTEKLHADAEQINPLVLDIFRTPPQSFADVIARYAALFKRIDSQWRQMLESAEELPSRLENDAAEQIRQVLYGHAAPCIVPDEPIVHIECHMDTEACVKLWKLQGDVDRWLIQAKANIPHAVTLVDRSAPSEPRVFRRGNPATPGEDVPRQFLVALSDTDRQPFVNGSGRRELAEAIIDPRNPLTARVIVNRVWMHHFGRGLVATPSDFGTRAGVPSHPQLLDWLAHRFVEDGWSIKQLHRRILNSSTFRQSSFGPEDTDVQARAQEVDPGNHLLWRMNTRRLSFEQCRDSLLAVGGGLDRRVGGKPTDLFATPYLNRRTIYGLVDRQFFPNTLRVFDFANPDLHISRRPETTVPQQALYFLNHEFLLERARQLALLAAPDASHVQTVQTLFHTTLQREPSARELSAAVQFLREAEPLEAEQERPTVGDWQYGFGRYNEETQTVTSWTHLPHFDGSAWQGGPEWPDASLGWVQLTATGGHPGNDRDHAAIRRWTAPRAMIIGLHSKFVHEAAPGDGIRVFVVSSHAGQLDAATIHQQTHEYKNGRLEVEAGETIDVVTDIGGVLNNDQYNCQVTLTESSQDGEPIAWNSQADFTRAASIKLTPVEQLAQALLSSNEFLFID